MTARRRTARGLSWAAVRRSFLPLPGVVESTSYRTPAFKVAGKLLARLREDGEDLVVRANFEEREMLMVAAPEFFHVTDHYVRHPWVLVRLAEQAWRAVAPKRAVAVWDAARR